MLIAKPRAIRTSDETPPLAIHAVTWCAAYALSHLWFAVAGDPAFFGRGESFFPGGWVPVVPAVAASLGSLLAVTGTNRAGASAARWLAVGLSVLGGLGMMAYCMLMWISLAMLLMVPFGASMSPAEVGLLLVRVSGVLGGGLAVWVGRSELLRWRAACRLCHRRHGASVGRTGQTPWWGLTGGYLAIVGLSVRVLGQGIDLLTDWWRGSAGFQVFVALMIAAGTVLPLALVHRWGRIWPRWVVPWAGRAVPRWAVLGPAVFMGCGLVAYFGIGGIAAMVSGAAPGDLATAMMIGGYAVWGVGLLIAATSYAAMTRPRCPRDRVR